MRGTNRTNQTSRVKGEGIISNTEAAVSIAAVASNVVAAASSAVAASNAVVVNAVAGTSVITNSVAVAVVVETGGTTIKTRRVHRLRKGHNSERMVTP